MDATPALERLLAAATIAKRCPKELRMVVEGLHHAIHKPIPDAPTDSFRGVYETAYRLGRIEGAVEKLRGIAEAPAKRRRAS